ncbi:MAG: hypothetical protein OHK0021_10100 [Bryobacter sp.]
MNKDGRGDVAIAFSGNNVTPGLVISLGAADGSLGAPQSLAAGNEVGGIALGDFNADGNLDLAYSGLVRENSNFNFHTTILPGNGAGGFGTGRQTAVDTLPGALTAGDFNGDGKLDLMLAHCCGGTQLTHLWGNGDGSFSLSRAPGGTSPVALTSADFDGDGALDYAVVNVGSGNGPNRLGAVWINHTEPSRALNTQATTNTVRRLARNSIVAAYGEGLANATATAPTPDWPTELAGTTVNIRDSQGQNHAGRIYYASPTQVNYLLPETVAEGWALVSITPPGGQARRGVVRVGGVSPGLFAAGSSVAVGFVVYAPAGGEQRTVSTVQASSTGIISARPITLGAENDQEVLLLFGSGLRNHGSLSRVKVRIGGVEAPVLYAGPQNEFPGLDQLNVSIPKSLRGRRQVDVEVEIGEWTSNLVRIFIL